MNIVGRSILWLAACAGLIATFQLLRKNGDDKQAHKSQLHDWENEGGNLASAAEPADTSVTTSKPDA